MVSTQKLLVIKRFCSNNGDATLFLGISKALLEIRSPENKTDDISSAKVYAQEVDFGKMALVQTKYRSISCFINRNENMGCWPFNTLNLQVSNVATLEHLKKLRSIFIITEICDKTCLHTCCCQSNRDVSSSASRTIYSLFALRKATCFWVFVNVNHGIPGDGTDDPYSSFHLFLLALMTWTESERVSSSAQSISCSHGISINSLNASCQTQ